MQMMRVELFLIADLPSTEDLLDDVCESYGGYTSTSADGAYRSLSGDLILDEVLICTLFIEDTWVNRRGIHSLMQGYKDDAEQESVLYVINGNDATFITE